MGTSLTIAAPLNSPESPILLISVHQPKKTPVFRWMNLLYGELFSRLDIPFILQYIPPARASAYAVQGKIDGQVGRMASYSEKVQNQIKVNEPIYYLEMVAYVRLSSKYNILDTENKLDNLNSWKQLAGKGFRVEYMRGISIVTKHLEPLIPPDRLTTVTTLEQGFSKLKAGRTDVFIASNHSAYPILSSAEYRDDIASGGVLFSTGIYPHLHKRHHSLVPEMEKVIREMKASGLIEAYRLKAYSEQ